MGGRYAGITNPLDLLEAKQKIDPETVDLLSLAVLLALDAAKRAAAPAAVANTLTEHLLTSAAIWSITGNKPLYKVAAKAWDALRKASARPTKLLDLTTGEYAAIRLAVAYYVRALPKLELGVMLKAQEKAFAQLRD
jgi:hypothetical protein